MIKITRVYSDDQGESHFEDINVDLYNAGKIGWLSDEIQVRSVIFREVDPTYDWDFHNAPVNQYIILLDGEIEIETSSGDKRIFKAGDIILVEDTEGKGHRTRNLIPERRRSVFITL